MKIFSSSDIHGNFIALAKIIDYINSKGNIDIVLFCGDIAGEHEYGTVRELAEAQTEDYEYFKEMIKNIKALKVYYILGNHDVFKPDMNDMYYLPNVIRDNKESLFIPMEIVKISYYGTSREGNEIDISNCLKKLDYVDKNKIIVAHQPPHGILDKNIIGFHYGSKSVEKFLLKKKPMIYFCGHVHESFGVQILGKTFVVNSACNKEKIRGVLFDTEKMQYELIIL